MLTHSTSTSRNVRHENRSTQLVESLEGRQLMSATPVAALSGSFAAVKLDAAVFAARAARPAVATFADRVALPGVRIAANFAVGTTLLNPGGSVKPLGRFGDSSSDATTFNITSKIESLAKAELEKAYQAAKLQVMTVAVKANHELLIRVVNLLKA